MSYRECCKRCENCTSSHSAADVAKFIINYCNEKGRPVNNIKLNKILYFLWIDYYKETGLHLFNDVFQAWDYGPVVQGVYYEYSRHFATPLTHLYPVTINKDIQEVLKKHLENYIGKSTGSLIERSQAPDGAWGAIYKGGVGKAEEIPFRLIIRLECASR